MFYLIQYKINSVGFYNFFVPGVTGVNTVLKSRVGCWVFSLELFRW